MSALPAFDTLSFARRLSAAGMDNRHAEALAEALQDAIFGTVATKIDLQHSELALRSDITEVRAELKSDIAEVRSELKSDIAEVRAELKADIAEVRSDLGKQRLEIVNTLTLRMGAIGAFLATLIVTILGVLISSH